MPRVIQPNINKDDDYFWAGVAQDRILIRRCAECDYAQHPPTPMCPRCSSVAWVTRDASGKGYIYSWIVSKPPHDPDDEGRIVAVVELEEGVRLVSNVVDVAASQLRPGFPVEVTFAEIGEVKLPQFRPVATGRY
jgi:uncharacterized OB-fold protein